MLNLTPQHLDWYRVAVMVCAAAVVASASGQSLQDRIEDREGRQARAAERERNDAPDLQIDQRLATRMNYTARGVGIQQAMADWSRKTRVPLVIDWNAMEFDGVDPDREIDVVLDEARAYTVLLVLMDSMSTELTFIAEVQPWGVQVRSRARANLELVTRVYDVRDLLINVPQFTDAPSLSLAEALSNTSSGGGGSGGNSGGGSGGGASGIFDVEAFSDADRPLTKRERGELLVQLVRDTIEPDLWRENGGAVSRARYFDGRMIVRAPLYVHLQIGRPAIVAFD
ncbi:MAG: hypothetical protein AAF086_01865 [Planctomycetota bacterium]